MKKLYFYANQVYQLSYALPFYNKLGGIFVVNSISKYFRFMNHLANMAKFNDQLLFNTPKVIVRKNGNMLDLEGVILSFSNSIINVNPQECALIFHEHGASDKRIGSNAKANPLKKLKNFDYIFLMSPKNLIKIEKLCKTEKDLNILKNKFIKIENLRFIEYSKKKSDKNKILSEIGIKNFERKTVLYAPTWRFGNGTLQKYFHRFAKEITKEYNLIVRPHFHEAKLIPQYQIWAFFHNIKNIYFSNPSNLQKNDTFADFIASDILLSDNSAVLYEYLITNNPIIIVNPKYNKNVEMPSNLDIMKNSILFDETDDITNLIDKALQERKFSQTYEQMFSDCFYQSNQTDVTDAIKFVANLLQLPSY